MTDVPIMGSHLMSNDNQGMGKKISLMRMNPIKMSSGHVIWLNVMQDIHPINH